mmetsp:Transcript_31650/g.71590  ORF Transcript_31650/g.71590 Transcript_31650/m.71590 type:complete len:93 (+) Transcript_31650:234-512(+)
MALYTSGRSGGFRPITSASQLLRPRGLIGSSMAKMRRQRVEMVSPRSCLREAGIDPDRSEGHERPTGREYGCKGCKRSRENILLWPSRRTRE